MSELQEEDASLRCASCGCEITLCPWCEERLELREARELRAENEKLRGLIHSETLADMNYCDMHEMAFQTPVGAPVRCPRCREERCTKLLQEVVSHHFMQLDSSGLQLRIVSELEGKAVDEVKEEVEQGRTPLTPHTADAPPLCEPTELRLDSLRK